MPTDFTEKTTNRHLSEGDLTSTIASSALLRIMQESDSLYKNPSRTEWVQKKIDIFKGNLRAHITHKKLNSSDNSMMHWPEEYAQMLREELEYIETCIEYNDKTGNMPQEADLSKPLEEGVDYIEGPTTRVVGHIDLSKPDRDKE
tara:strand:+ start:1199 stop:1633 length:435 start_codon:yes stop_codon:yes gene_type:complete